MTSKYNVVSVDFNPFEGHEIEKVIVTNESQRELWLSCMLGGEDASLAYNESVSLTFEGKFNVDAFKKAIHDLSVRHEALRAVMTPTGEQLIIYKDLFPSLLSFDLSNIPVTVAKEEIQDFIHAEIGKAFDLYEGPLLKLYLHRISEDLHHFTLIIHHLIGDGWSIGIILEDLGKFYNAYCRSEEPLLPTADQISDYAFEQVKFKNTSEYTDTQNFWLKQYEGPVPVVNMPLDYNRPVNRTYLGKRNDYPLDAELLVQLKQLSAKSGSSLVVTLVTVFEVLLYHITGETDLVIGLPAAGQLATDHMSLVGHCVNLLPLRSKVNPDQSFAAYLKKRRSEIFDAYDHQKLTFGELIRALNIKREKSRIPLVPIVFNVDMGMDEKVNFDGLTHHLFSNARVAQTFEISLNVNGAKNALIFEWGYNTQLFTSLTIDRLMEEFEFLLKRLCTNPDLLIREAVIGTSSFPTVSGYTEDSPTRQTIVDLFSKQVSATPEHIALEFEDNQISYRELDERSNQLANYLIDQGVKKNSLVAICINRSFDMLIGILGIIKSGAAYVPIDPSYPTDRIQYILEDSKSNFIITDLKSSNHLKGKLILLDEDIELIKKASNSKPEVFIEPNDLLYIIYTSGSTGKPKGVMIAHQSLANYVTAQTEYFGINDREKVLQFSNYCFDASIEQIFLALLNGSCLVLLREDLMTNASNFSDYIIEHQVSHLHATPGFLENLNPGPAYPHLKRIISAGESCKKELVKRWLGKVDFYNKYGPTECTISVLEYKCSAETIDHLKVIPIGKAIKNSTVYILDEKLRPAKSGELYVGGIQLAKGYLNQPVLTEKSFIDSPFKLGEHLYKTGDLARWTDDENIEFLERSDDQVKIRGYRIEIGEIESVLAKFQKISQYAVIAVDDENTGKKLVAYVVATDVLDKEDIKTHLLQSLPEYMVPKIIIQIDKIPLTSNGKVDKRELQHADIITNEKERIFRPAENELQKVITKIWSDHLGIARIGIDDDFFELGGHSLVAVRVMTVIEKEIGVRLPLASLFDHSTIEKLAALLEGKDETPAKWDSLVPIKPKGSKKPVYLIHGGGLNILVFKSMSDYMDPEQPVYALQALGLNGKTTLYRTIEEIAEKYNAEIMQVDPSGPYLLAGYSLGGKIAYEMARQLIASGKEVKMLGIFDTFIPSFSEGRKKFKEKLLRQIRKIPFIYRQFIQNPMEAFSYQFLIIKRKFIKLIGKYKEPDTEVFTYNDEIIRSYDEAYKTYKMTPMNIGIDLFRVKKRIYYLDDMIYLGWKPYGIKGIDVHEIPGDHKTFLFPPNDKELGIILQRVLDKKNQL